MRFSPSGPSEDAHQPALDLPFRLRGYDGQVAVYYTPNQDPVHWGFDVPGLLYEPFDLALAKGYPICEARTATSRRAERPRGLESSCTCTAEALRRLDIPHRFRRAIGGRAVGIHRHRVQAGQR
jgi:hypothetical protein